MTNLDIPDPAFWAITKDRGAQLIDPKSELHELIDSSLDAVPEHDGFYPGDIFVASESSSVISPEDLGIDRSDIENYIHTPEETAVKSMRKFFSRLTSS